MATNRKTAILLGTLFLMVMISWSTGYALIGSVLSEPGYLGDIYPNRSKIFAGVIFELIDVAAIVGIIVLMFPIIKKYSERMALCYLGLRLLECVMLIIAIICALTLITLGDLYHSGAENISASLKMQGTIVRAIRDDWVHLVLPFFYGIAAIIFYYFFYKTRLIPRFISIWGILGAILVLAGIPMDFFDFKPGAFAGALMGLNELFLGFWLIIKGFNTTGQTQAN